MRAASVALEGAFRLVYTADGAKGVGPTPSESEKDRVQIGGPGG